MHRDKPARDDLYRRITLLFDNWTISIALGCLTVLFIAQGLLRVPAIHNAADRFRSGFTTVVAAQNPTAARAIVELSLAPAQANADIAVLVDGVEVANFSFKPIVNISVQSSQHITIQNGTNHVVYVTINQSDPALLVPSPGQRVVVAANSLANFPAARFQ